jgi:hypothetical protein
MCVQVGWLPQRSPRVGAQARAADGEHLFVEQDPLALREPLRTCVADRDIETLALDVLYLAGGGYANVHVGMTRSEAPQSWDKPK